MVRPQSLPCWMAMPSFCTWACPTRPTHVAGVAFEAVIHLSL